MIDRSTATTYADWFRCLGDPTRIQILNLLATTGRPMAVGEIADAVGIGQPTISHHVKQLAETRFVSCEARGASTLVSVNGRCLSRFPSAAKIVMGTVSAEAPPWIARAA